MSEVMQQAEALLAQIGQVQQELANLKMRAQAAIEWVTSEWAEQTEVPAAKLKKLDKALVSLMKRHKGELFDRGDRLDLKAGALLLKELERVKKARGVLEQLLALDWREAIRIVEEVRWEVLETWPEEKLIACGTERVKKEAYEYEIYALREAVGPDPAGSLPGPAGKK